jgi:hypothetical protein
LRLGGNQAVQFFNQTGFHEGSLGVVKIHRFQCPRMASQDILNKIQGFSLKLFVGSGDTVLASGLFVFQK